MGATLAQSGEHFPERTCMPRSSPQNQANSPQNDVSEPEETARRGTGTMPQALLSSPDSGMIVLSSSARILHMNGPARALMALFGVSHELWPQMAPESMPFLLTDFCCNVLEQLQYRIGGPDWAQFEMRRICHMITPSLLLTGFGVPNSTNDGFRIILTLDAVPSISRAAADSRHLHLAPEIRTSVSVAIL